MKNFKNFSSDVVRNAARGSWLAILNCLAPEIESAILRPGIHIPCPVHGGKDGFRLFRDADTTGGGYCNTCGARPDGFSLLMWLRNWNFPDVLTAVANEIGLSSNNIVEKKPIIVQKLSAFNRPLTDDQIKASLRTIWEGSRSIRHPDAEPLRLYLNSRGLDGWVSDWPSIRFHQNMQYRDVNNRVVGYYPGMIALVEKENQPITIFRMFLTHDGQKAPVDNPKKMMLVPSDRTLMGSAIQLAKPGRVLNVTEGFENALAVIEATSMVTWPLINSALMAGFIIPKCVEKIIIWGDLDRPSLRTGVSAGLHAAETLAKRAQAQGVEALIRLPEGPIPDGAKSVDWLDVLNQDGPNAFNWAY